MAGITLAQAQARLDSWLAAHAAVASAQSYEIETGNGRRKLTRADAEQIRTNIDYWQAKVTALTPTSAGGRRRITYVVPE